MADATQVQIRRDTASNLAGVTPVLAELAYDLTNKRLRIGDGLTLGGGAILPNAYDVQNQAFQKATVGGTANALTLTASPVPTYNSPLKLTFKATATNTTAVTVNVNSLGVVNINKATSSGIVALVAGDILNGGIYEIVYDGTKFILLNPSVTGLISVGQADLRTSLGSGSVGAGNYAAIPAYHHAGTPGSLRAGIAYFNVGSFTFSQNVTLPGGSYGFLPRIGLADTTNHTWDQTYITASPPYDLGDGEVGGFVYVLLDSKGEPKSTYIADTPPWAYNGPTDIRSSFKCPKTGKKYRNVLRKRTFDDVMNGKKPEYKFEEITHKIKNADIGLIPHPFGELLPGERVVLLDPMEDKIRNLIDYQNDGGTDVSEMIMSGKIKIDNSEISSKGPRGVLVRSMKYKYSKRL